MNAGLQRSFVRARARTAGRRRLRFSFFRSRCQRADRPGPLTSAADDLPRSLSVPAGNADCIGSQRRPSRPRRAAPSVLAYIGTCEAGCQARLSKILPRLKSLAVGAATVVRIWASSRAIQAPSLDRTGRNSDPGEAVAKAIRLARRSAGVNLMETISVETRAAWSSSWRIATPSGWTGWTCRSLRWNAGRAREVLAPAPFFRRFCRVNSWPMAVDLRHPALHSFRRSAGGRAFCGDMLESERV